MTKLLICGSRAANPRMIDIAWSAVDRAKANGWTIVVGDAFGVDKAVVDACQRFNMPCEIYGITPLPRNIPDLSNYKVMFPFWAATYTKVSGDYLTRDRVMVEVVDAVFAIWNGISRGTIYTYNHAVKQGKQAWLKTV